MAASAAQFEFAAEIVTFLVALAGVALVILRSPLYAGNGVRAAVLGAGFLALGAAGFVHGAIDPDVAFPPAVTGLRLGAAVLLLASLTLPGRRGSLLWPLMAGSALLVAAAGAAVPILTENASEALLLGGAVAAGLALVLAGRRSIGARLTATAAATLLLIVVVMSVALSTVLSNTVRQDAVHRLETRAESAAASASQAWQSDLQFAKLVSSSVEGLGLAEPVASGQAGAQGRLSAGLSALATQFFSNVYLAWVAPGGTVTAMSPNFLSRYGPDVAQALADTNLVRRALAGGSPAGTSGVVDGQPMAVGAYHDLVGGSVLGAAVAVTPLDSKFLYSQVGDDSTLSAVLVAGGRPLSSSPASTPAPGAALLSLARTEQSGRPGAPVTAEGRYVAASVVEAGSGRPVMVLLVETPTAEVDAARQSLFHSLFLIALGGAVIAFLLSVLISERLNRVLQQLTAAAGRISAGESGVRTGVVSSDEIGVLASAFDTMAASVEDKTDALRQAALDEAFLRSRLESVVSGMGEALVALGPTGDITEFNSAAERLLGRQRARTLGRRASSLIDVRLDGGGTLLARLAGGLERPLLAQGALITALGEIPVGVSAAPFRVDQAESPGTVVLIRDLRPERELERMKTEFLSRIGHELRTPLTAILGFARLLASRPVPLEQAELLHTQILEQSNRLLRTVQMLEFFASAGANRLGLDPIPVLPGQLLDEAAERWASRADGRALRWRTPRRLPEVQVDRRLVGLALDELIDNAIKFSPDGGAVSISAALSEEGGVAIAVVDRGQGMTDEESATAFAEFVQGDSSDTRRFGGLGLGLPLARTVVEAHGGRIEMSTRPGRGSTFTIQLPPAHRRHRGGGGSRA
jgi:signal transduction histidine kinase/HAMP domain-containing protein